MHAGGGRWVRSNKLVELKTKNNNKKNHFPLKLSLYWILPTRKLDRNYLEIKFHITSLSVLHAFSNVLFLNGPLVKIMIGSLTCSQENWVKWSPVHHIFNYFLSDYFGNASIPVILLQALPLYPRLWSLLNSQAIGGIIGWYCSMRSISVRFLSDHTVQVGFTLFSTEVPLLGQVLCPSGDQYIQSCLLYASSWLFNIVFNQMNLPSTSIFP